MTTADDKAPQHTMELFIDGHCAHCRSFGRNIARLDGKGRIKILSFRDQTQHRERGLSDESVARRMHAYSLSAQRAVSGLAALQEICRTLPVLRPLLVPLWVLAVAGLGDRLYDFLARHRVIAPDQCAAGGCSLEDRPSPPREKLRSRWLAATAAALGVLTIWHFAATLVHIMPSTSIGLMFGGPVNAYMEPLLDQRWKLFAPEPPLENVRLNVQCRTAGGQETPWLDTDRELSQNHARIRFTPSSYLLRLNRAAIADAIGVQDDFVDEMIKAEDANDDQKALLKTVLRDQAVRRIEGLRFLYRLAEHHCAPTSSKPVVATRARIIFQTIPKFSKRNDPSPSLNTRQVMFEWVDRGKIDQYVAAKRDEAGRAIDKTSVEDLKKSIKAARHL